MRCVGLLLLWASFSCARSLLGVIDVHAHVDPETIPRSVDAITLARLAQQEGMRAVVFKNHFFPSTGIAFLVHRIVPGIAREDIALATGHISPEESLVLIREARGMGINRIIVTHPTQGIDMSIEQQKEAAQMGAFLDGTEEPGLFARVEAV
jgi:hypothetical protein